MRQADPASNPTVSLHRMAWRNLWRVPRRTWLTAGGVGFSVWLLITAQSFQDGTFEQMIDNTARLSMGHIQMVRPDYLEAPEPDQLLHVDPQIMEAIRQHQDVLTVAPRVEAFALISSGERSYGGQVVGVDAQSEQAWSSLPGTIRDGHYLRDDGDVVIGSALAKNLGVEVGDEVVMLGSAAGGGVAASAGVIAGIFDSGIVALDRAVVQIGLDDFRNAWSLQPDEVHRLIILTKSVARAPEISGSLRAPADAVSLAWPALMPQIVQMAEMKKASTLLFFLVVAVIALFSVVNSFTMVLFERTREFATLLALGMRRWQLAWQLQLEAFWMALLGVLVGGLLAAGLVSVLHATGVPLPVDETMISQYNISARVYPAFSVSAAVVSAIGLVCGVQLAAAFAGLRLARISPVLAAAGGR